jgi:hypothetical protein
VFGAISVDGLVSSRQKRRTSRKPMGKTYEARVAPESHAVPNLLWPSTHFLDFHCGVAAAKP